MRTKWEALQFAITEHKVTAGAFITLARLLDHFNLKTFDCYPSESTLARKTGYSTRQVRCHIRILECAGYIQTFSRSGYRSNAYHIPILTGTLRSPTSEERSYAVRKYPAAKPIKKQKNETAGSISVSSISERAPRSPEEQLGYTRGMQIFENRLVERLGGRREGWEIVGGLGPFVLKELRQNLSEGKVSLAEALDLALIKVKEAMAEKG